MPVTTVENPNTKIEQIKYRGRETARHLLTVDDLILYRANDGGMVVEFVRYNEATKRPVEGYRLTICPEDADRIRSSA